MKPRPTDPQDLSEVSDLRLGGWWVRPAEGFIEQGEGRRHLSPRQMDLLLYLARHAGRVLSKEELLREVWGAIAVEDGALTRCLSELRKHLGDNAREPSYIETLNRRGYRWIASVETEDRKPEHKAPPPYRTRIPQSASTVVLCLLLLSMERGRALVAVGGEFATVSEASVSSGVRPVEKNSIAIADFKNLTEAEEHTWLSLALPEMLAAELAASPELKVVSMPALNLDVRRTTVGSVGPAERESLPGFQEPRDVEYFVRGSFLAMGREAEDRLRLDVWIEQGTSGETLEVLTEVGQIQDLLELLALIGARMRERLGFGGEAIGPIGQEFSNIERDPEAIRLYYEGIRMLRRLRFREALDFLSRSVIRQPKQPFAHLARAEALLALGQKVEAREAADRVGELTSGLPRDQRLWLEAGVLGVHGRWSEAIEVYQALWLFAPTHHDCGLKLASAELAAGDFRAALASIETLRQKFRHRQDPRRELIAARSLSRLGQHESALAFLDRAMITASDLRADLIQAEVRRQQAISLFALGRREEATVAVVAARTSFALAGVHHPATGIETTFSDWWFQPGPAPGRQDLSVLFEAARTVGEGTEGDWAEPAG